MYLGDLDRLFFLVDGDQRRQVQEWRRAIRLHGCMTLRQLNAMGALGFCSCGSGR